MDNLDKHKNSSPDDGFDTASLDEELDKLIPLDDNQPAASVSHDPLSLGGNAAIELPTAEKVVHTVKPVAEKTTPAAKMVSTERITGVKTFFTKLHAGAIDFLDEQITNWLNNNPGVTIKRTNTVTGPVQGKKTEPNIIVTVWY